MRKIYSENTGKNIRAVKVRTLAEICQSLMYSKLKVLLLLAEFPFWRAARHLSYSAQLGIEDGLRGNGVNCLTITSPWLPQALRLFSKHRFDQVWVVGRLDLFDEESLERITAIAPVRLAMLADSLEYTDEEYFVSPTLKTRKQTVEKRLQWMTHILSCDERDVEVLNASRRTPALWWPQAVPERFISENIPSPSRDKAVFYGACYGVRREWLRRSDLKQFVSYRASPETGTVYPFLFNALHLPLVAPLHFLVPVRHANLCTYLVRLRYVRERCFANWLKALQTGRAIVNLPHLVKTYAGRVVEGMAAGRPVLSWEIPERPRNKALFEDGKEILLFPNNNPHYLADQLERILRDHDLSQRLVANARKKLRRFHTAEIRVRQILDWVTGGRVPQYS